MFLIWLDGHYLNNDFIPWYESASKCWSRKYLVPLFDKVLSCEGAIWVDNVSLYPIALGDFLHFIVDSQESLSLCICLGESRFELLMSYD